MLSSLTGCSNDLRPTTKSVCVRVCAWTKGLEDPASELKLQVQRKHLLVTAKGKTE